MIICLDCIYIFINVNLMKFLSIISLQFISDSRCIAVLPRSFVTHVCTLFSYEFMIDDALSDFVSLQVKKLIK